MMENQFRNSKYEIPEHNGTYQWKIARGCYVPVKWIDGSWYSRSGDPLGKVVTFWR